MTDFPSDDLFARDDLFANAHWLISVLTRANEIASTAELDDLLDRMLDLILDVCEAQAGTLYLLDRGTNQLVFKVVKGEEGAARLVGERMSADAGLAGAAVQQREPILVDDVENDPRWFRGFTDASEHKLKNALSFPLLLHEEPIGVVQLFNYVRTPLELVQLLGNRIASEIDKALLLQASQKRNRRLQALIEIVGKIGSSLDRDQILEMIVAYAQQLLEVEACSLFMVDEESGDLMLHFATNLERDGLGEVRVPAGKGIIGFTVQTGETVLVPDTLKDERYYGEVDRRSGFQTRSILAVPLRTRTVDLGEELGISEERIIGGLEAINKSTGTFDEEDSLLLETLANQAATVFQIARLYANTNELFIDVMKALTAAIDAKDPYTQGHSQRVSNYSVAIAREMELKIEEIHHIRIAALLHDVGKIGISDIVLKKPGALNEEEFCEMKKHPLVGEKIMGQVHMLKVEAPAIGQHHERLDGTGYPQGLQGENISLASRIVAVADVFDALTSTRYYRKAQSPLQAFNVLCAGSGTHFDPACVQAIIQAYQKGEIQPAPDLEEYCL